MQIFSIFIILSAFRTSRVRKESDNRPTQMTLVLTLHFDSIPFSMFLLNHSHCCFMICNGEISKGPLITKNYDNSTCLQQAISSGCLGPHQYYCCLQGSDLQKRLFMKNRALSTYICICERLMTIYSLLCTQ